MEVIRHKRGGPLKLPRFVLIRCIISFCLAASVAVAPAAAEEDVSRSRTEALRLARVGSYVAALDILAELRTAAPADIDLIYDQAIVLSWAERDDQVLQIADDIAPDSAPSHVLEAIAKSARNLKRFEEAEDWYRRALDRNPASLNAGLGLAMTLADRGKNGQARDVLESLHGEQGEVQRVQLASAYVYMRGRLFFDAFNDYDSVLRGDPDQPEALRGKVQVLRVLLLPVQALTIAERHAGLFSEEELAQLIADELALEIRLAVATPAPDASRYAAIDTVIDRIEAELVSGTGSASAKRRLQFDRIEALTERRRMQEAVIEYESQLAGGGEIPAYVHAAAGKAYLDLRQAEQGLAAFQQAVRLQPDNIDFRIELFYGLAELDRYDEAIDVADSLVADTTGSSQLTAGILAAMGRAYGDRLDEAQNRLEGLLIDVPGNTTAREELGNVYRWRGWSNRAMAEFGQVIATQPDSVTAAVGLGHTRMDLQAYPEAEAGLAPLRQNYAGRGSVKNLARRWQVHNRGKLIIDAAAGRSSGDAFGSDQYQVDAWWYTRPLDYRYRIFVHTFDAWADFEFGSVSRRRAGVGAEYRKNLWTASVEGSFDRSGFDDAGFSGRVSRVLSDAWSITGLLQLNSYETPLRGHRVDVDSDLAGINVSYRRDELLGLVSGIRFQDYSDGNEHVMAFANGHWRRITRPGYKMDFTGSIAASSNSLGAAAAYFNPDRDFELMVGADNRWMAFRRYDESLVHRIHARLGLYNQQSFGSDVVWSLDYELRWNVKDTLALRFGLQRGRRVYDGNAEDQTYLLAGVDGWF